MNKIIRGDNIKVMKEMLKKGVRVDLLLTDPPYNVSRKNQLGFSNMGRAGMHFGEWDYEFDQIAWLEHALPLISKNGSILIFNDWKNMGLIASFLSNNNFVVKDLIKWEKSNPMPRNVNRRYVTDYEFVIWATKKGGKWTFNKPESKKYLRPQFKNAVMAGGSKRIHPTQKPESLISELIKIHSNEGDIIFDPFSGSGSTGKAAHSNKRKFIMIEKNKEYYEKSKVRFEEISTSL